MPITLLYLYYQHSPPEVTLPISYDATAAHLLFIRKNKNQSNTANVGDVRGGYRYGLRLLEKTKLKSEVAKTN